MLSKNSDITRRKSKVIFLIVCFALIIFALAIIFGRNHSGNDFSTKDWAFHNEGQIISNTKGKTGVDINLDNTNKIADGHNIVVAVVDTGIDSSCSILKNSILCDKSQNPLGYDFYNNKKSTYSEYLYDYHGTYISTTIVRVAPKVKILPVKFMSGSSGTSKDAIKAIKYAIEHGVKNVNCSWNITKDNKNLCNIIKSNPDILFVCSAGNNYLDLDKQPLYPCNYDLDNVISVMGIDNKGEAFDDSGYGMTVDIGAPGKQVNVIFPEDDQDLVDGSSVSAAFVSGAAALMLSKNPDLSVKEVIHILKKSSKKLSQLKGKCQTGGHLRYKKCIVLYTMSSGRINTRIMK